jgi:hypothetical protein
MAYSGKLPVSIASSGAMETGIGHPSQVAE